MKKILTVLLCAVLAMGFTACAQQAAETSSAAPAEETGAQVQDDAIYGKVTAVSGNEATIALGTVTGGMSGGTPPDLESGEMPSGRRRICQAVKRRPKTQETAAHHLIWAKAALAGRAALPRMKTERKSPSTFYCGHHHKNRTAAARQRRRPPPYGRYGC